MENFNVELEFNDETLFGMSCTLLTVYYQPDVSEESAAIVLRNFKKLFSLLPKEEKENIRMIEKTIIKDEGIIDRNEALKKEMMDLWDRNNNCA